MNSYAKDYAGWHKRKKAINDTPTDLFFSEREIWWMSIGHNIGDEEDGKGKDFSRPVIILRKFNQYFFYGVPLTSKVKAGVYYHSFTQGKTTSTALLSHMREYDAKRLIRKMGTIDQANYRTIQKKLIAIIARPAP